MSTFPTIEEFSQIGEEIIEGLPPGILAHLNGGILIRKERKNLKGFVTLGQYNYQPRGLGRFILIFYGSFKAIYGGASHKTIRKKLRETICHELLHHWENLSGTNSMAKEEAKRWREYFL